MTEPLPVDGGSPRKLRICFVIPAFSDGGAQKQCIFLLNHLRHDPRLELTLVHFHGGVHADLLERDGLRVIHMPVRSNYDPRNILALRRILKETRADLVMSWLHAADVVGFFVRASMPKLRWIMTERNSSYPVDPRFILRKLLGRHADVIVANSAKGALYWQQGKARGRLHVVPNIVFAQASAGQGAAPRRIVSIGRLEAQKNTGTVVEAFALLAARHAELAFAVIGDGVEAQALRDQAAQAGAGARIDFMGFRKDVAAQIEQSGLVVSMSHHEGLPNVMLEAVAARRLVVASDIPEHRELLGDDYPFLVADRTDPQAVAAMIEAALARIDDTGVLAHAVARLESMTPLSVGAAYTEIFQASAARA